MMPGTVLYPDGSADIWYGAGSPDGEPLKIIIAGGGIGGLTAAIALREQGHQVDIYEQSQFANEIGAAIHIVPNANSVLQRLGVNHEEEGAIELLTTRLFTSAGKLLNVTENKAESHRWQKPWLQAHRGHLHTHLKRKATSSTGNGPPARLHTSSRIVNVDPSTATLTLSNGEQVRGDLVVGADGVHSKCRSAIAGPEVHAYKSDSSAFRFMVARDVVLADPETRSLVESLGSMDMFYGDDRKAVMYPCFNNTLLNFVCLHPAELSDASAGDYNKAASKEALLEVYKDFSPQLLKVFHKCDPETLKVYPLFDVETLPTFVNDRLALIGDAAHPFTPHLAQGGAMAIEDAASLGVMLSRGVTSCEVPTRLRLYNKARYERATTIQNYSRIVGGDGVSSENQKTDKMKLPDYINYALSHDEHDYSIQLLREHQWKESSKFYWRQPTVFGPMPGPRQGHYSPGTATFMSTTRTAKITFKTSATLLRNMLPNKRYSFAVDDTVATASLSVQTLGNVDWLGGGSYDLIMFQIHGVQYKASNGEIVQGRFCAVLFENLTDPILSGREELGWPKLFSDIDIQTSPSGSFEVSVSWRGAKWANFWLRELHEVSKTINDDEPSPGVINSNMTSPFTDQGLLVHKFVPSTTDQPHKTKADADYPVFMPNPPQITTKSSLPIEEGIHFFIDPFQSSHQVSSDAGFSIIPLNHKELPTIHHIVSRLAEIPIFEVIEAQLSTEKGMRDFSDARRVD